MFFSYLYGQVVNQRNDSKGDEQQIGEDERSQSIG